MRSKFTVGADGKVYQCEREITGKKELRQTIYVIGVGSKADTASYGRRGRSPGTMESIARLIAHEIIRQAARGR